MGRKGKEQAVAPPGIFNLSAWDLVEGLGLGRKGEEAVWSSCPIWSHHHHRLLQLSNTTMLTRGNVTKQTT